MKVLALAVCLSLSGCGYKLGLVRDEPQNIYDYGQGVLYFNYTEGDFGHALSAYLKDHPDKKVVSVAPDDTSAYGYTKGYFVVVEAR